MAGKWIKDLRADTPLADAARRVLTVRLEVVRKYLPLAVREADKDIEYVHQLRVSTRRARAALDIFALCLPRKVYKTAKNQLRCLRQAAGEARDWDVFLEELTAWQKQQSPKHRPGIDFLLGFGNSRRELAQGYLQEAATDHPFHFDRFLTDTLAAIRHPQVERTRTLLDLARPQLASLLEELNTNASQECEDHSHLHQVRISGKRLRYAMEVFAPCFEPAFREHLYPVVQEMQEILGNFNDSHVALDRLGTIADRLKEIRPEDWKRYRTGIEGLLQFHHNRLPQEQTRFQDWWQRWRATGTEASMTKLMLTSEAHSFSEEKDR